MGRKRKRIDKPLIHTHYDTVTGQLVSEVRDDVWYAVGRAVGTVERSQLLLPPGEPQRWYELVERARRVLDGLEVGDRVVDTHPLAIQFRREWEHLDESKRVPFLEQCRARLGKMVPHRG